MYNSRLLMLLVAGSLTAGSIALHARAQNANPDASPQGGLRPPASVDLDTFRENLAPGSFGLKPQSASGKEGLSLPFSLRYSRETRSVTIPLDEKSNWDVGLMLNVNSGLGLEPTTAPALGLQPKRAPGIMLQKRF